MEIAFNGGNADWEITRYAGVDHGFTAFDSPAYNLVADVRSWESMLTTFEKLIAVPMEVEPTPPPTPDYPVEIDVTAIDYMDGDHALMGHLATPEGEGPFPAIVIVP